MVQGSVTDDVTAVRIAATCASRWRHRWRTAAHTDRAGAIDVTSVHISHTTRTGWFGATVFVFPFIHGTTSSVHEEIADRRRFQAQLFGYRHLHLFRWSFRFLNQKHSFLRFIYRQDDYEFRICTLKMAWSVRRCKSVKTKRGFFGDGCSGGGGCSSLRLQTTATMM